MFVLEQVEFEETIDQHVGVSAPEHVVQGIRLAADGCGITCAGSSMQPVISYYVVSK